MRAVKIAISLPAAVLAEVERERRVAGESRSEFFRLAVERRLRDERRREDVERYVRAYQEQPEDEEEIASARALGAAVLASEPWE
jgi:metal-responsive CopG/Arc/MetJ family transcriptional regulator